MERLNVSQESVDSFRTLNQGYYPDCAEPLPGSILKLDDDVVWLGFCPARVVWGYPCPEFFMGYAPEWFGEATITVEGWYITDRAPVDPEETPMPIFPEDQMMGMAMAAVADRADAKVYALRQERDALQKVLLQLSPKDRKAAKAKIAKIRPELLA